MQRIARIILAIMLLIFISPFFVIVVPRIIDVAHLRIFSTPEQVLTRFYTERDIAEDQTMDPLILAGSKMVPLLEKEIFKKGMPKRSFAIIALGHLGDNNSIPILEQILQDKSENEFYRGDALTAIALIDLPTAQRIAPHYLSETGMVSKKAKVVLSPTPFFWEKRPYWDAFFRVHN